MKKTFMSWLGAAAAVAFILIPVTAAEQTRKEKEVLDVLEEPAVTEIITEAATETTTTVVTTTVVTTTTSEVLEEETEGEEILELGYHVFPPFRCRGYAKEACQAIIQYAIEELNVSKFLVRIAQENVKSKNLAMGLGFQARR